MKQEDLERIRLLSAPIAQRTLEKEATKSFNFKEKIVYYSQRKTTWLAVGGAITAVATNDYQTAVNIVLGFIF